MTDMQKIMLWIGVANSAVPIGGVVAAVWGCAAGMTVGSAIVLLVLTVFLGGYITSCWRDETRIARGLRR